MNSFEQLKQNLIDFLFLIQNLTPGQISGLSQLITPAYPGITLLPLQFKLQDISPDELQNWVKIVTNNNTESLEKRNHVEIIQFTQLYHLSVLQLMLKEMTLPELYKFFDVTAAGRELHERLLILVVIQEIFAKMDAETLTNLHTEFHDTLNNPRYQDPIIIPDMIGNDLLSDLGSILNPEPVPDLNQELVKVISNNLHLSPELFYIYEPLKSLLMLTLKELEHLQSYFTQWDHTRLSLLVRLIEVGLGNMCDVQDIVNLLVVGNSTTTNHYPVVQEIPVTMEKQVVGNVMNSPKAPSILLEIAEHPPEKCVYKRNIKPAPTICLVGDQSLNDGFMFIQPLLIRCDTGEEINQLLEGAARVKITSGRTLIFKRLKILSTSHQLNETLFSLKFELRRYPISDNQEKYEMIHSVTTSPICVVSHSTQIRVRGNKLPTVTEVIPLSGPPSGATRVVILGNNFIESPTTLVKFDNAEVKPFYHGPRTLICHTPKHPPGTVKVKVCNDLNKWSDTEASYTYDGSQQIQEDAESVSVSQDLHIDTVLPLIQNSYQTHSAYSNDIFSQLTNFGPDVHGFSPLHYSAAFGLVDTTAQLLSKGADPTLPDKLGNTPLFWAASNGHLEIVRVLLKNDQWNVPNFIGDSVLHVAVRKRQLNIISELILRGAMIDIQNNEGETPLHIAVIEGYIEIVKYLLEAGARADLFTIDGCSPIHYSAFTSSYEILKIITKQSLHYLNSQDEYGDTVVHWAVRENDRQILKMLFQLGAACHILNNDAETPLTLAENLKHQSLIPLIKTALIQKNCTDGISF